MAYEVRTTDEFESWLDALRDYRAQQAILRGIVKLQNGLFGNAKSVSDGVSELKIDVGAGYRAYFVTREQTIIVMLCGGDKSSQDRDIKRAKEMASQL